MPADTVINSSKLADYKANLNLKALKRLDPAVTGVIADSSYATLYVNNGEGWDKAKIEGPLFIVERSTRPSYGVIILNRNGVENFNVDLRPETVISLESNLILFEEHADTDKAYGIWLAEVSEMQGIFDKMDDLKTKSLGAPAPRAIDLNELFKAAAAQKHKQAPQAAPAKPAAPAKQPVPKPNDELSNDLSKLFLGQPGPAPAPAPAARKLNPEEAARGTQELLALLGGANPHIQQAVPKAVPKAAPKAAPQPSVAVPRPAAAPPAPAPTAKAAPAPAATRAPPPNHPAESHFAPVAVSHDIFSTLPIPKKMTLYQTTERGKEGEKVAFVPPKALTATRKAGPSPGVPQSSYAPTLVQNSAAVPRAAAKPTVPRPAPATVPATASTPAPATALRSAPALAPAIAPATAPATATQPTSNKFNVMGWAQEVNNISDHFSKGKDHLRHLSKDDYMRYILAILDKEPIQQALYYDYVRRNSN